jgi:4-amino-4-deoxy-L-arabinose transferase-like glycosyltransferase
MKSSTLYVLILILLGSVLFFANNGRWDLWDPDEPRYAEVAREMVNSGDWILMHLNGKMYSDKPPLFFWLIALSSYLWGGFTSFAVRFTPALFGMLTVLLTFFLGKNLYSPRTGFLAGLILATSVEFAYLSTRANIDTTLTFFTTASLFCFIQWYRYNPPHLGCESKRPSPLHNGEGDGLPAAQVLWQAGVRASWITERNINDRAIYGFYIAMALGTLAKGPVGFIIPLLVSLIYLTVQRDWKGIKGMRLLPGMLLFLAIVLSWYVPAVLSGGKAYLQETLFKHTVDAYARGWTHVHPFYYYFLNFPVDFLPWILFLPGVIFFDLSKKEEGIGREFLFILVWFVSIFLFFSFSKGKRGIYLLPLYPAASVMVGKFWDNYISNPNWGSKGEVWVSRPVFLLAILLLVTGIGLSSIPVMAHFSVDHTSKLVGGILKGAQKGEMYLSLVPYKSYAPFIFLSPGLGILLLFAQRLKRRSTVFVLIVLTVGITFFYGTRFIFPRVNPYKSARFLSQEIRQTVRPGERLAMYGGFAIGPYNFYTGIVPILDIDNGDEMATFFRSKERVFCLIQHGEYEALKKRDPGIPLHLITQRKVGSKDIVLVSNQ